MRKSWPAVGFSAKIKKTTFCSQLHLGFKNGCSPDCVGHYKFPLSFELHTRLCYPATLMLLGDPPRSTLRAKSQHCPTRLPLSEVPCSNIFYIGYNKPTLCTDYYSFIYYSGSYMFRHLCAIFRECNLSL
jgi:hypothetical protein